MSYRLRTLGGVSLSGDGRPMEGSTTQRRRLALLTLIAAVGERGVSRDRLLGILWPDSEPGKARQVLTQWLHLIRRDLGDDELFLGTADLRLNPERITSDIAEFDTALERKDYEAAAALYAGPFLDGFYIGGAPEFERWVDEQRARIASSMREAYQALAAAASSRGDLLRAAHWAERFAALDPLDARGALLYMNALAAAGERERAIRHAGVHAEIVRAQLETEPDPAIAALVSRLRSTSAEPARSRVATASSRPASEPLVPAAGEISDQTSRIGVAPPRTRARWRVAAPVVFLGGAAAAMILIATAAPSVRPAPPRQQRVMVAPFENETGDSTLAALGRMASDWIVRGVGETGLLEIASGQAASPAPAATSLRDRAVASGAGTLITGRIYKEGDSLAFQAQILDVAADRVLGSVGPILTSRAAPLSGIEVLRRRAMGSVAALVDQRFSPLGTTESVPPSYEAFQAVSEGHLAADRRRFFEAIAHFRRAAALDTNYLYPLVQIARAHGNMFDCARVDSAAAELAPRTPRLLRYEKLLVDREVQLCAGDLPAAHRTSKALLAERPTSTAVAMYVARCAGALNRQREVIELLMPSGVVPSFRTMNAYHLSAFAFHSLGEYQRELEVAQHARERFSDMVEPLTFEGRARAALGDLKGVREVVVQSMVGGHGSVPGAMAGGLNTPDVLQTVAHELRAHGHAAAAHQVTVELRDWLVRHPPAPGNMEAEREYLFALFGAEIDLERWDEAAAITQRLAARFGRNIGTLASRGRLAAYRGDIREAERLSDSLGMLNYKYMRGQNTHARAQIAALLGQRERAVQLLRDALAEGVQYDTYRGPRTRSFNHALPEFQSLRGYPPFEELLRPRQ
jgi:DNA-binding SARP family transcriptional activator/TolB-like protein